MCSVGKKVKASEAALLKKLNFKPFQYGMLFNSVYDEGAILPENILNLDPSSLLDRFESGARNICGLSLATGYPIAATIPLIINNAFKNIAALSLESGYFFIYLDSRLRKLKPWAVDLLLKLKKKNQKKKPRKKLNNRLPHLLQKRKKNQIWEICSDDRI